MLHQLDPPDSPHPLPTRLSSAHLLKYVTVGKFITGGRVSISSAFILIHLRFGFLLFSHSTRVQGKIEKKFRMRVSGKQISKCVCECALYAVLDLLMCKCLLIQYVASLSGLLFDSELHFSFASSFCVPPPIHTLAYSHTSTKPNIHNPTEHLFMHAGCLKF